MTDPIVSVSDAFVAFSGAAGPVMALRGLDLRLELGERLLVQGPNGSGKSTLLRVITGEQPVTAGTVRVGGTALHELDATRRRRWRATSVGFIDQHARRGLLPELSVLGNVMLPLRLSGVERPKARRQALDTLARLGLESLADRGVTELSGGEAQRVATCAAVAHGPQLVLADEPTGELDEESARGVYELLAAVAAAGTGIILVSHDARSVRFADRAVRIRDGRTAEQWRPGSAEVEQLTDSHGWARIPAELLPTGPPVTALVARARSGGLLLEPRWNPAAEPPSSAEPRLPAGTILRPLAAGSEPLVRLVGVSGGYPRTTNAPLLFSDLDLELAPGSWAAVTGPSGSGKSTLLALVAGLLDPLAGMVLVAGSDWADCSRAQRAELRRRIVTVTPQRPALVEALTVEENLMVTAEIRASEEDRVAAVAEDLGLTRLRHQPVSALSGGERQRVSLARSLVSEASVLVLDEPTSQQDDVSADRVVAALVAVVAAGRVVLVASHDPRLIGRADTEVQLPRTTARACSRSAG